MDDIFLYIITNTDINQEIIISRMRKKIVLEKLNNFQYVNNPP